MSQTKTFANHPGSVRDARRFAADQLSAIDSEIAAGIVLMVSELVTNSICHAHSDVTVTISITSAAVRAEVTDTGSGTPTRRSPSPAETSGRGLQIVADLSDAWGVRRSATGDKAVWFTVRLATGNVFDPSAAAIGGTAD